ncbi:MAG TPA: protein kinase [Myxococcales bacterium]|nr:protein kinase [Myxococcales bacterium]
MDAKVRDKALERARSLEKAGQGDAAAKIFREVGAVEEAARVLGMLRRPRDAAQLLIESLGVPPAQAGRLDAAGKKRALMAAIFLGRAGDSQDAVRLFLALGEQQRAVDLLQKAGDAVGAAKLAALKPGQFETGPMLAPPKATAVGGQAVSIAVAQKLEESGKLEAALQSYVQLKRFADAARCAKALGRKADAAQLFADAGLPFEAAQAYLELGDTGKALENLCRVPAEDPQYRVAAAMAVRMATNLSVLDFRFENFVGAYVRSGPRNPAELQVFDLLAALYESQGFPENAREALQKLLAVQPKHPGAAERLARLDEQIRPSAMVARQVLSNADLHKRRMPVLPDLGDLPDLAGPPAPPGGDATVMRSDPELVRRVTGPIVVAPADEAVGEAEVLPDDAIVPAAPEPQKFEVGATVAARYRLEAKIGQGGMAAVFRAFDLELEEDVALKVFDVAQTSDVLVARFKQELKLSRQLIHPNIIRLYDIGAHNGHRYISMELLVGKSLKDRMKQPIEFRTALGFLIQACHGLQAAHDAAVIHRDVKPDNFFVTDDGVLKVMDFGIAKQYETPGVTVAGSIAGTPLYMSPEQIGNFSAVTPLTDIYALGVCAYEMFSGQVPFFHAELVPLLMMHVNTPPRPPREHNPHVPPRLEAAILKLLAKDPKARYQSCRELAEELGAIRDAYA